MKTISKAVIRKGIALGLVALVTDPNAESGTVCKIGDNWFYFGGLTAEEMAPEDYLAAVGVPGVTDEIYDVLKEFETEFPDEHEYYRLYLEEHGVHDPDDTLRKRLLSHVGHHVVIVTYGDEDDPADVCLECEDCGEVILDSEIYTIAAIEE